MPKDGFRSSTGPRESPGCQGIAAHQQDSGQPPEEVSMHSRSSWASRKILATPSIIESLTSSRMNMSDYKSGYWPPALPSFSMPHFLCILHMRGLVAEALVPLTQRNLTHLHQGGRDQGHRRKMRRRKRTLFTCWVTLMPWRWWNLTPQRIRNLTPQRIRGNRQSPWNLSSLSISIVPSLQIRRRQLNCTALS